MTTIDGWENFYVIVGSSAAALTGLMFVVITLTAETRAGQGEGAMNAFASPTVLHFCFVLLVAAIVSTPRHSVTSLSICLGVSGLVGLVYATIVVIRMRRQNQYAPVLEDWIWHAILPVAAYASITISTMIFRYRPDVMLYVVGASALLLLYVGIHNAWDAAIWMATTAGRAPPSGDRGASVPPSAV